MRNKHNLDLKEKVRGGIRMVKIDQTKHNLHKYREIAYRCIDDFIDETNKWGFKLHRGVIGETGVYYSSPNTFNDDLVFKIELEEKNINQPIIEVFKKEYFNAVLSIAEKIEKQIGDKDVEILIRELYR